MKGKSLVVIAVFANNVLLTKNQQKISVESNKQDFRNHLV